MPSTYALNTVPSRCHHPSHPPTPLSFDPSVVIRQPALCLRLLQKLLPKLIAHLVDLLKLPKVQRSVRIDRRTDVHATRGSLRSLQRIDRRNISQSCLNLSERWRIWITREEIPPTSQSCQQTYRIRTRRKKHIPINKGPKPAQTIPKLLRRIIINTPHVHRKHR